jgi:transposase
MGRVEPHTRRASHGDHSEAFIGIDTAKLRNAVAIAEAGRRGEVRYLGEVDASEAATRKLIAQLAARYGRLTLSYEAGPTGYGLYRLIESLVTHVSWRCRRRGIAL